MASDEPMLLVREVVSRLRRTAERIRQERDEYRSPERFDPIWRDGAYHGADKALMQLMELIEQMED